MEITLISTGNRTIEISTDDSELIAAYARNDISSIEKIYNANPPKYKYPTMTIVSLIFDNGHAHRIELQDVSNQATWNDGSAGAATTAFAAFNTWYKS